MINLIICDDEITIRQGLKKMIEKNSDYINVVEVAANGVEAYKYITEYKPEVVLLDITMPGMDGFDVINRTLVQSPATQFVIVTGHDEFHYAQKAVKLHVFDYLLKPIQKDKLLNVIKKAAAKSKEMQIELLEQDNLQDETVSARAIDYILKNYSDPEISLAQMAESLFVSESYLTRIIKSNVGKSYSEYVTQLRMEKAKSLLIDNPDLLVKEVAEKSGYNNRHYFCNIFKTHTGFTPTEYRNQNN